MFYIRQDQADIRVSVDMGDGRQAPLFDSWATYEGGTADSEDQKTRPGGMGDQVAIGGPPTREDVTVTTQFTDLVASRAKQLEGRSGKGSIKIAVNYLDPEGNRTGFSFTRIGVVKSVAIPNVDANGADVAFLTLVASVNARGA